MSLLDAWGWIFSAIYATGNIMIARKYRPGWMFRIIGALGWIWIGCSIGLTSIFFIEGTAVITSIYGFYKWKERVKIMTVNEFAVKVSGLEKGKKEVNIAQIKEILKVINKLLNGELYKLIRNI